MREDAERFRDLAPEALATWAEGRAVEMGVTVPAALAPAVLENLAILQAHSRRVADALRASERGAVRAARI